MMIKRILIPSVFLVLTQGAFAQKQKVQAAWRALSDYQSTLSEKPEISFLNKAKEAIDLAAAHEDTKNSPKMYVYRTQIYYELFKYNLKSEEAKLAATIVDKNALREAAYGNVATEEFTTAGKAIDDLQKNTKDQNALQEVTTIGLQMISDVNNLAVGRYKLKRYDEAADFFNNAYYLNKTIGGGKKDTASLFNAVLCAQKAKNYEKSKSFNQKMIDEKIANAQSYQYLYNAKLNLADTAGAVQSLTEGRSVFPNDLVLLNLETEYYLQTGKQQEALNNLLKSLEKDPNNAILHFAAGSIYDNMANPKGKSKRDTIKPANFAELFASAEEHYKKAVDLKSTVQDYHFNSLYNLGALYNNYGGYLSNEMSQLKITELATKQKDYQTKINDNYNKAIPYLEQALGVKPDDKNCMTALRKLYYLTGNTAKSNEMNARLKGK